MCDHTFPGKVCLPDPADLAGGSVITLDSNNGEVVIGGPKGGSGHRGHLVITDASASPKFTFDGATGESSQSGAIVLLDNAGNERVRIAGQGAEILLKNASGQDTMIMNGDEGDIVVKREMGGVQREVLRFDASHAALYLGCEGNEGDIIIRNNAGQDSFHVDGNEGDIIVRRDVGGTLRQVMKFDASHAALYLGCNGNEGDVIIRNNAGQNSVHIDGNEGDIIIRRDVGGTLREVAKLDASHAALYLGCEGNEGDIIVRNNAGQNSFLVDGNEGDVTVRRDVGGTLRNVMRFDASHAAMYLGCEGNEGDLIIHNNAGEASFHLDGNEGDIFVRRQADGALRNVMQFDASHAALYLGCQGNEGDLIVRDGAGNNRIHLDGHTGDIRLQGADCAEQFEAADAEMIEPGTVLVIDEDTRLRPCSLPYDKKVAGVVSGANGYSPGIVMDDSLAPEKRVPVALNGKVYCKVDAGFSAIEVGDLLTTSPVAGHAMKATDQSQAFGAVIGKALGSLDAGCGLIPVLVSLQ